MLLRVPELLVNIAHLPKLNDCLGREASRGRRRADVGFPPAKLGRHHRAALPFDDAKGRT